MSDDAATTTDPMQTSDVGERRRAIRAERERRAQNPGRDEPSPPPPTSLVRPYARIAPPGAAARSGLGEDPDGGPDQGAAVEGVEEVERVQVAADASEAPAAPDPPTPPAAEPFSAEPFAAEPETAEAAGWSLFTPVVPPEPPAYDDDAWPGPPSPGARPSAEVDEWAELSLRVGDDDAWLRALRRSLHEPGGAADDLGPDPDEPAILHPVPLAEEVADDDARPDVVPDDVVPDDVVPDDVVPDDAVPGQGETQEDESEGEDLPADGVPPEEVLPVVPDEPGAAFDGRPLVAPPSPFRRPPAERLTRALSDDPAARPDGSSTEEADGGDEHVRGTLEPVLRRSTARAKITPVLQPAERTEAGEARAAVRAAPVSWNEAMAANVVPAGKAGGRRLARARHESAGTEDYRPRPGADRSLTLLVLSMLLVLAVLVGLAAWAFWPRVVGARSVPPVGVTGTRTAQHG